MKTILPALLVLAAASARAAVAAPDYDAFLDRFVSGSVVYALDARLHDNPVDGVTRMTGSSTDIPYKALDEQTLYHGVIISLGRGPGAKTVFQRDGAPGRSTLDNADAEIVEMTDRWQGIEVNGYASCHNDFAGGFNPIGRVHAIYANPRRQLFVVETSKDHYMKFKHCSFMPAEVLKLLGSEKKD